MKWPKWEPQKAFDPSGDMTITIIYKDPSDGSGRNGLLLYGYMAPWSFLWHLIWGRGFTMDKSKF